MCCLSYNIILHCDSVLPPVTFRPLGTNEAEADDELDGDHTPRRFKPATHRAHIRAGFEEALAKRRSAVILHTPSKPPGLTNTIFM